MNVAIIGTGAYGMALASVFYNNKCNVKMWTNSEEEKNMLLENGKSDKVDFIIDEDSLFIPREKLERAEIGVITVPPYQKVFKYQKALIKLFKEKVN